MKIGRTALASALLAFAPACTIPGELKLVDDQLPESAAWLAVLAIGEDGAIIGATGLVRRERGLPARLLSEGANRPEALELIGYSEAAIAAAVEAPSPQTLIAGSLRSAAAEDPLMPEPVYAKRFLVAGGAADTPVAAPARELTAPWLPPCPKLITTPTAAIDVGCALVPCGTEVRQMNCRVEIDAGLCGSGELRGIVGPRGSITWERADLGECISVEPPHSPALLSAECMGQGSTCTLEIYPPGSERRVSYVETQLEPVSVPPYYGLYRPVAGYVSGMAVLENSIAVAGNQTQERIWFYCPPDLENRLVFLDQETLAEVSSVAAPYCLQLLAKDPGANTFVGVYGGADRRIARFSADGTMLDSKPLNDPRLPPTLHVAHLEIHELPPRISLLLSFEETMEGPPQHEPVLVTVAPNTFEVLDVSPPITTARHPGNVAVISGEIGLDRVAVLDNGFPELFRIYDLATLDELSTPSFWDLCSNGRRASIAQFLFHAPSQKILAPASSSDTPQMFVLDADLASCSRANAFQLNGEAFLTWPFDQSRVLVAVTEPPPAHDTHLLFFEPALSRFLPGTTKIGKGPAAFANTDSRGRVWLALPWEAKVIRVDATERAQR